MHQRKKAQIKKHALTGFTLPEMLLSVALFGILVAITIPIFQTVQVQGDLSLAAAQVGQSWRRAQILSSGSRNDHSWGVYVETGSIVLFEGESYALRDTDYDEVFAIADTITLSGPTEVVFDQLTGAPSTTGSLTLTGLNNQVFTVIINEKGMVEY